MFDSLKSHSLLKLALLEDAVASGVAGLAMAAGAGMLHMPLGLPRQLLLWAGVFLIAYAVLVGLVGTRSNIPRGPAWFIAVVNLAWAVESVAIIQLGWVAPTPLGLAFVIAQSVLVLGFALLQIQGLRQVRYASA